MNSNIPDHRCMTYERKEAIITSIPAATLILILDFSSNITYYEKNLQGYEYGTDTSYNDSKMILTFGVFY